MPKTKAQKHSVLQNLIDKLDNMKSAVFVNFSGIPVKEIDGLRQDCKKEDVKYEVTKKTLLKKALAEKGLEAKNFEGEVATVIGLGDEVTPAKLIAEFAKGHENMQILGGILEGKLIEKDQVVALAKLPGRDELIAKAVGSIAAPLSGMVNVLQGNLRNLVYALNAIKESKQ